MILVTGGAGFIGANFVLDWLTNSDEPIINLDKLTYAGNLNNLKNLKNDTRHVFVKADINDSARITELLNTHRPRAILHFAAESHVDRSIHGPAEFIKTNINGTFSLLEAARTYWQALEPSEKTAFRFLHVSTDEVFGSLVKDEPPFTEETAYAPNSPYSASKAAADHLVRAYFHSYGLPVLTTNCSNNYGPLHFPEKLIPLVITNARKGKDLPIYGNGQQVRDWLYVGDHCSAIRQVLARGQLGQTYNIGGWNEQTNINVVHKICDLLDQFEPKKSGSYRDQIKHVQDRPGHDQRYAIDARKIATELGWKPAETFESGLAKTVQWYLQNDAWTEQVLSGDYLKWIDLQYNQLNNKELAE